MRFLRQMKGILHTSQYGFGFMIPYFSYPVKPLCRQLPLPVTGL